MANESYQTTSSIRAMVPVVINLGLSGPSGYRKQKLVPSQRVVLYSEALKEIMMPGYTAEIVADFDTEPTMIVEGMFAPIAESSLLVWDMLAGADQDCCAISYQHPDREGREGLLFGPHAAAWGAFNAMFFLFPSTPKVKS